MTSRKTTPPAAHDTNGSALEPLLLGAKQAAHLLDISMRSLWSLSVSGQVPSVKLGARRLYRPESLRAWLEKLERGGVQR